MWLINRRRLAALIIALLTCGLAGCYTLLKHPKTGDVAEDMDFASCTDCHESYFYPGPYDPRLRIVEPPWWYPPVVVVDEGGKRRTIVDRDRVERVEGDRLIGGRGIETPAGITPGPGTTMPPAGGAVQAPSTPAAGGEHAIIKRQSRGAETGTRPIEDKKIEKRSNQDSKQSDTTKVKK
jgi:hypothetical protein